jgi:hypothetical protein
MVEVVPKRSRWFRPEDGHYPPLDVVVLARWKIGFLDRWAGGSRVHFVWYDSKNGDWCCADDGIGIDEPTEWRHLPPTLRAWQLPRHPS